MRQVEVQFWFHSLLNVLLLPVTANGDDGGDGGVSADFVTGSILIYVYVFAKNHTKTFATIHFQTNTRT